jgi:hypothetical protein
MNTKTKAENLRLFAEARSLRESVRSGLHRKAINASDDRVPWRGVRSVSRSGRRVIVSGWAGA